jgi:hypothetical protein
VKTLSRWHRFGYLGDVQPSSGTSNLQAWAIFLRPYPRDINPSFINLSYAGNSSSGAVSEGFEDDAIAAPVSPPEAPVVSPLARMIRAVHKRTSLDEDIAEEAKRAIDDAWAFANRELSEENPFVMVSDDGLVMLQWRDESSGVLLIFTGDGTGNYSIKRPGGSYTANNVEFSLSDGLPAVVRSEIERIVSA